ncbi:hypothetical protein BDV06DRAFT_46119 [Aspergillus oleicola]
MHTPLCVLPLISRLLEEGRARIDEALHKGYAPSHFSRNLELILVEDTRSAESLSMKTKIASTRERSACLRAMPPPTLIWWATAFPMRQWSGGRKISASTFESLVQQAPRCPPQIHPLLEVVADDLERLGAKYPHCEMLQCFLETLSRHPLILYPSPSTDICGLSEEGRYISLSGASIDWLARFPDLLRHGVEGSRAYQKENHSPSSISTALKVFVPTDPVRDDAYALVPIGTNELWPILQELRIID